MVHRPCSPLTIILHFLSFFLTVFRCIPWTVRPNSLLEHNMKMDEILKSFRLPMVDQSSIMPVALGAAAMMTTAMCGMFGYHLLLTQQRAGEPKVAWSSVPVLGDAIEFGQRPIELVLRRSREASEAVFGLLLAGDRIFFVKDQESYGAIFKVDKTKVRSLSSSGLCPPCFCLLCLFYTLNMLCGHSGSRGGGAEAVFL